MNDSFSQWFYDSYNFDTDDLEGKMIPVDYDKHDADKDYQYFLRSTKNRNQFYLDYILEVMMSDIDSVALYLTELIIVQQQKSKILREKWMN